MMTTSPRSWMHWRCREASFRDSWRRLTSSSKHISSPRKTILQTSSRTISPLGILIGQSFYGHQSLQRHELVRWLYIAKELFINYGLIKSCIATISIMLLSVYFDLRCRQCMKSLEVQPVRREAKGQRPKTEDDC